MRGKNIKTRACQNGFTLVELMIVSAIIGLLASIMTIKVSDLIWRAREAQVKGVLGAMRSSLTMYYANMEGVYPKTVYPPVFDFRTDRGYLYRLPVRENGSWRYHTTTVQNIFVFNTVDQEDFNDTSSIDWGRIGYFSYPFSGSPPWHGKLFVVCSHVDSRGNAWSRY